jgi:hypothetical protein
MPSDKGTRMYQAKMEDQEGWNSTERSRHEGRGGSALNHIKPYQACTCDEH